MQWITWDGLLWLLFIILWNSIVWIIEKFEGEILKLGDVREEMRECMITERNT